MEKNTEELVLHPRVEIFFIKSVFILDIDCDRPLQSVVKQS
jgi:hypothetical protein